MAKDPKKPLEDAIAAAASSIGTAPENTPAKKKSSGGRMPWKLLLLGATTVGALVIGGALFLFTEGKDLSAKAKENLEELSKIRNQHQGADQGEKSFAERVAPTRRIETHIPDTAEKAKTSTAFDTDFNLYDQLLYGAAMAHTDIPENPTLQIIDLTDELKNAINAKLDFPPPKNDLDRKLAATEMGLGITMELSGLTEWNPSVDSQDIAVGMFVEYRNGLAQKLVEEKFGRTFDSNQEYQQFLAEMSPGEINDITNQLNTLPRKERGEFDLEKTAQFMSDLEAAMQRGQLPSNWRWEQKNGPELPGR